MADTAVAITAGTGTNIDTRTEATNGNHRQVVVVGDPSINAGVAPVDATAGLKVNLGADNDVTVTSGAITETNSTAILADTANMDTNLGTIAGAVAGTEMQVDVLTMPTTTVTGTVTADLGATDNAVLDSIASNTTTTAAGYAAEGSALGSGVLLQGDDGTDRKNINVDATTGDVQVDVTNTVTVDLGANNDVTVTGTVDLGATDNAVLDSIAAKDFATQTTLAAINAKLVTGTDIGDVTINNSTGANAVNIQDGGNTITVDGTVAATQSGTWNVGTTTTVTTVGTLTGSGVAHDAADSGNPHKMGGKATNVEPSAVSATGDRSNLYTTMTGKLITAPHTNPENIVSGVTAAMTGTTSTSLIASPGAGLRNYVTTLTVSNSHATVGTDIEIQDGSGGTTIWVIPAAAVYGGGVVTFSPPLRQPTAATALYVKNTTTGASTRVSANGYKGA